MWYSLATAGMAHMRSHTTEEKLLFLEEIAPSAVSSSVAPGVTVVLTFV